MNKDSSDKIQIDYFNAISILKSEPATTKLLALSKGINVNGIELAEKISDYPQNYRTKRAKKNTKLINNQLLDVETENVPFIPEEIFLLFPNGRSVVKINYNAQSPFKLVFEGNELYLTCKELFIKIKAELSTKRKLTDNEEEALEIDKIMPVLGSDRVAVMGYEGCSGWYTNRQCKFCDSCALRANEKHYIPTLNDCMTKYNRNLREWISNTSEEYFSKLANAYKLQLETPPQPHFHLHLMSGNMEDTDFEWEYMLKMTDSLNKIQLVSLTDSYLNLIPPHNLKLLSAAKEKGFQKLLFSMEVFGENDYKVVCPEKYALSDFNHFIECLKEAVNIFGKGKVRCNFVLGAQHIERLKNGVMELANLGVASDFTIFTPKKGTPWENKPKPTNIEIIEFTSFLYDIYKKYNFDGLYCCESSRSCVLNELLRDRK